MQTRTMIQMHGLPPFLSWREAGGLDQGGPADASVGLQLLNDQRGTWAWNGVYGEWMLLHTVVSGDTLWGLTRRYYGESTQAGVYLIGNVEQNRPILGSNYRRAIPGDVILIPSTPELPPPGAAPPGYPPPGAQPPPGGDPVPQPDEPPVAGAPQPVPGLPTEPPPFWPPGMPYPPVVVSPEVPQEPPQAPPVVVSPPVEPPPGPPAPPPEPILARVEPEPRPETWWTTTRVALVGSLSVVTLGLIVWGATRGAKRRTRRRRAAPRRRRRR